MTTKANMQAAEQPTLVSEFNAESRIAIPAILLAVIMTTVFICFHATWYWYLVTWVLALAVVSAITWKAFVEPECGVVREEARLFGTTLLAQRRTRLNEFEAIVVQHIKTADDDDWRVGLRHRSGRKIWMRHYVKNDPRHPYPEFAATGLAMALSERTKLPIRDYLPLDVEQWLRRVKLRRPRRD